MLPNFLCIGAQKAGTTSIWKLLNAHPDVFMASPRETQFFHDELKYAEGLTCYEARHFSGWNGQPVVGEKCPEYLYVPQVAGRIRESLSETVRFIVSLRSPAQRAWSHYRHNVTALRELRPFEEALAEEAKCAESGNYVPPPFGYVGRGQYAKQIRTFLELFPRDQFLFVDFASDICSDQRQLALRIYRFLGIRPFLPRGLPFVSGQPALNKLEIEFDAANDDRRQQYVRIRRRVSRRNVRAAIKQLLGVQTSQDVTIHAPSQQTVRFAEQFQHMSEAPTHLSVQRECSINQQFFRQDIDDLRSIIPIDAEAWLGQHTRRPLAKRSDGSSILS